MKKSRLYQIPLAILLILSLFLNAGCTQNTTSTGESESKSITGGKTFTDYFPDATFAEMVATALEKRPEDNVTELQLASLQEIANTYETQLLSPIKSIEGVQYLTGLQTLALGSTEIAVIPPEIGKLKNLTNLILTNSQISEIPPEIRELTNLTELNFANDQIRKLPSEIGNLTNLTNLTVTNNQLQELPPEINSLTSLEYLSLNQNLLSALPSEMGALQNLRWLNLEDNLLRTIPETLTVALQNRCIFSLYLANNQLTDFPTWINGCTPIKLLSLGGNPFTSMTFDFSNLENLSNLSLKNLNLTEFPIGLSNIEYLLTLDLSNNFISTLPEEITQISSLSSLNLSFNNLTSLPENFGDFPNLQYVYLDGNMLTELPASFGNLPELLGLHLEDNDLTKLPDSMEQLSIGGGDIYLQRNHLTSLPASWVEPPEHSIAIGFVNATCQSATLESKELPINQITKETFFPEIIQQDFKERWETLSYGDDPTGFIRVEKDGVKISEISISDAVVRGRLVNLFKEPGVYQIYFQTDLSLQGTYPVICGGGHDFSYQLTVLPATE